MLQPLTNQEYWYVYTRVPRLSVELVIRSADDSILLVNKPLESYRDHWHLPGGKVNFRETLQDAVRRIAKSELGLEVEPGELLGYVEYFWEARERSPGYIVGLAFECQVLGGQLLDSTDNSRAEYYKELPANIVTEQSDLFETLGFTPPPELPGRG